MYQQVEFENSGKRGSGIKEVYTVGDFFSGWQPWEIYWDFGEERGIKLKLFQGASDVTIEISRSPQANSMWNITIE